MKKHFLPIVLFLWTFVVTVSRALRTPNDFSEAYWLLDYRFGFIKRGLVGAICNAFFSMNPRSILFLSVLTFLGMAVLFFFIAYRVIHAPIPILLFFTSPFLVMGAHLLGYFDALLYILAIISIILVFRGHLFFAMFLSCIAIFTHESYLLLGLPLIFLAMTAKGGKPVRYLYLFLPLAAFFTLALLQSNSNPELLSSQITQHLDSFGFVSTRSAGVGAWQVKPFLQFFIEQSPKFWARISDSSLLSFIAPSLLFFFIAIFTSFRFKNKLLYFTIPAIILVPLCLHAIAWDTARISMYPIASAFLAWWILAETQEKSKNNTALLLSIPVFFFNLWARVPLMDGEIDRFSDLFRTLLYSPSIAFFTFLTLKELHLRYRQAGERLSTPLYHDI